MTYWKAPDVTDPIPSLAPDSGSLAAFDASPVMGDWGPWVGIDPVTKKRTAIATTAWYRAGDAERAVVFQPGYRTDRRSYGRHGMEIKWLLRGPKGVTQFVMFSGWEPGVQEHKVMPPSGADLGYHAHCPQYEGQEEYGRMDCDYLPEGVCFYDGSGMAADDLLARFLIEGEDVIWRTLAERHDALTTQAEASEIQEAAQAKDGA